MCPDHLRASQVSNGTVEGEDLPTQTLQAQDLFPGYLPAGNVHARNVRSVDLHAGHLCSGYLRSAYLRSAYLRTGYLRTAYLCSAYLGTGHRWFRDWLLPDRVSEYGISRSAAHDEGPARFRRAAGANGGRRSADSVPSGRTN